MTNEQIKGIARAINPHWWNDDIDLLDFTRAVLAREQAHDTALLKQALEALEYAQGGNTWCGHQCREAIAAITERLNG